MFYRIALFCLACTFIFSTEHVYLKTPNLSQENRIGTNVGIRPYRKSGVRLEAEWFEEKLIIHNYGYGGSGLTLSFGGAKEVLDILDRQAVSSKVVAVLGAGVAGLTTAYDLLERGYEVHMYSDEWHPNLTSNVAAGIWSSPSLSANASIGSKNVHQRMLEVARQRFLDSTTENPEFAGVRFVCCYKLMSGHFGEGKETNGPEEVVVHFDNGTVRHAKRTYQLGLDGKIFMEDLFAKVESKGAQLHQRHFDSISDLLQLEESIIINCTSMGSRSLFNDRELIPVRGELVYFTPQDGIDYLLFQGLPDTNYFFSIYPWSDRLILGGIYEYGEENPAICPEVIDKIIQNAEKCLSGEL